MLQFLELSFNFVIVIFGLFVDDLEFNSIAADQKFDPNIIVEFLREDKAWEFVFVNKV